MKVEHKLEDGKLIHEILEEKESIEKALDTQTAGEGYEWIPEGYARRIKKKVRIHQVNLNEMRELRRAKFLLRRHWWKGACYPCNTLIITPGRNRQVQRLKINDPVLDAEGKVTRVISTDRMFFNNATVLKIQIPSDKPTGVVLSPNHPVLIRRGDQIFFCEARDCKPGDLVKVPNFKFVGCEHYGPIESVRRFRFCSHTCQMKYSWKDGRHAEKREKITKIRDDARQEKFRQIRLTKRILKDPKFEAYLWGLIYGDCGVQNKKHRSKQVFVTFSGGGETAEIFDQILCIPIYSTPYISGFGSKGIQKQFNLPIERYEFLLDAKKDFSVLPPRINGNFWSFLGGFFDAEGSIFFRTSAPHRATIAFSQYTLPILDWIYRGLRSREINAKSPKSDAVHIYEQQSIRKFARKILPFIIHKRKRRLLVRTLGFNPHFAWYPILEVKSKPWNKPMYSIETESGTLLTRKVAVHNTVVRGMSVDHWDLVLDKGTRCLDEFAGMMNNPLDQPEGVSCLRHDCCNETPEGKPNKAWMKFFGEIPPNHPEWGNPNRRIPAYMDKVDEGSVNIVSDTDTFVSFMFKGKKLKSYWIAKRESPRAEIWVFSKSSLPGEPRKGSQEPDLASFKSAGIDADLKSPRKRWRQLLADGRYLANAGYVKLKKGEKWGNWTMDAILHYFAKIIDALRSVYFPISPPPKADKKSQTSYWKCYRASEKYMKSKPPSSDEVAEWNRKRKEIILARHRREKCMECDAPPKYEVLWAEGMAHMWLCGRHFRAWALKNMKEREAEGYTCDINMVREVQNGIAAKRWKDNTNPDIWPKLRRELSEEIS